MNDGLVSFRLASDTGANAGQRLAPLLRDRLSAIVAFHRAFALRRQRPSAKDRVLHRIVDLVLHRTVATPSTSHGNSFQAINA
jgi:hypothetical protein